MPLYVWSCFQCKTPNFLFHREIQPTGCVRCSSSGMEYQGEISVSTEVTVQDTGTQVVGTEGQD